MSHAAILAELPTLTSEERQDLINRLCDLQEQESLTNSPATEAEKRLLDQEWEDYQRDKNSGTPWAEVIAELRARSVP